LPRCGASGHPGAHPSPGFLPQSARAAGFLVRHRSAGLAELAAETDRATAALGVAAETRAFSPHLTLALN